MSNPSFPGDVLKIGWTREHPNKRANDLHTSGIPTPFIVEYVIITSEGSKLEKQIHEHIKIYRINSNRAFLGDRCVKKTTNNEVFKKYSLVVAINNKKCILNSGMFRNIN